MAYPRIGYFFLFIINIMVPKQPIGIFDSGIGGLTVAHAILNLLPDEQIIYFGDTAHLPYGDKSPGAITNYADAITRYLIDKNCKMVIIACNTASSVSFEYLVNKYGSQVHLMNVIDPVVEAAVNHNRVEHIGVIGTKGTIQSNAYETQIKNVNDRIKVSSLSTPLLVPMIEEGFFNNNISHSIIQAYLNYPDFHDINALILGCTHYPLIKKEIESILGDNRMVYDSTDVMATAVKNKLAEHHLLNPGKTGEHHFIVSDFTHSFEETTKLFFGQEIHLESDPVWDK
jgi:glutamate racemase